LLEDFGGFTVIMRASDVETDAETNFSGKDITRLDVLD
jgi:hypothetical protein